MIEPYNAVGLIPTFYGIRRREDIKHNIEHLKSLTKAAFWLSNLDIPVRLLAIVPCRAVHRAIVKFKVNRLGVGVGDARHHSANTTSLAT